MGLICCLITEIIIFWLEKLLIPVLGNRPTLLVMDLLRSHKTSSVRKILRGYDVTLSLVPAGCTGLVQPLDVSVNRPFKDLLKEEIDQEFEQRDIEGSEAIRGGSAVGEMRVMMTHCVARAWGKFCQERQEVVVQSFRCLGISLPIDGSKDGELSIKGLDTSRLAISLEQWRTQGVQSTKDKNDFDSENADDADDADDDSDSNSSVSDSENELFANSLPIPVETPLPLQSCAGSSSETSSNLHTGGHLSTAISPPLVDSMVGSARDSKGQRGQRHERPPRSVPAATGIRRSARLTGKPTRTYVVEFPQITDAEESDDDDGVEYDFRWQGGEF